jgi:hypothetical protein
VHGDSDSSGLVACHAKGKNHKYSDDKCCGKYGRIAGR